MRTYSRAPDENCVVLTCSDASAALLTSNHSGIGEHFCDSALCRCAPPPNAPLRRTLRAPASTPCLAPHTQNTAHTVRSLSRALNPAAYPPARALPPALSHFPILPRDRNGPSDRPAPRSPRPPAASLRILALRWQARPGATLRGRSAAASASRCRSARTLHYESTMSAPMRLIVDS